MLANYNYINARKHIGFAVSTLGSSRCNASFSTMILRFNHPESLSASIEFLQFFILLLFFKSPCRLNAYHFCGCCVLVVLFFMDICLRLRHCPPQFEVGIPDFLLDEYKEEKD